MYGPNLIIDKSLFYALSDTEAEYLNRYFNHFPTPILIGEVLGGLGKVFKKGKSSADRVTILARRFGGSGLPVHCDYRTLLRVALEGATIPMTGQCIPAESDTVRDENGRRLMRVHMTTANYDILRWRTGDFVGAEHDFAKGWQAETANLSLTLLETTLNKHHVIIPRPHSESDIVANADRLIAESSLQRVWVQFLARQAGFSPEDRDIVIRRLERPLQRYSLRLLAPYANHCIRAALSVHSARRYGFHRADAHDARDLQYLFYLPFFNVFASDDKLHRLLVPPLLAPYQAFVGRELKDDLRKLAEYFASLPPEETARVRAEFGLAPPDREGSIVRQLWAQWASGSSAR